jgi:hypothetical protein
MALSADLCELKTLLYDYCFKLVRRQGEIKILRAVHKHIGAILALNLQVTFSFSSSMTPYVIPFSLKGPGGLKV